MPNFLEPMLRAAITKVFHKTLVSVARSAFEIDVVLFRFGKSAVQIVLIASFVSWIFGFWPFLDHLLHESLNLSFLVAQSVFISLVLLGASVFLVRTLVRWTYPELDVIGSDEELIAFFKPLNGRQEGYIRAIARRERARLAST